MTLPLAFFAVMALAALIEFIWFLKARRDRRAVLDARYDEMHELTPAEVQALDERQ